MLLWTEGKLKADWRQPGDTQSAGGRPEASWRQTGSGKNKLFSSLIRGDSRGGRLLFWIATFYYVFAHGAKGGVDYPGGVDYQRTGLLVTLKLVKTFASAHNTCANFFACTCNVFACICAFKTC